MGNVILMALIELIVFFDVAHLDNVFSALSTTNPGDPETLHLETAAPTEPDSVALDIDSTVFGTRILGSQAVVTISSGLKTRPEDGRIEDIFSSKGFSWYPVEWSWVLILQLLSVFIGIIGNALVMIVLFQRRKKSRSTDILIGGLACADFLTSVFLIRIPFPASIPRIWYGEIYCRLIKNQWLLWTSVTASTYLLMAISVERYIAIVFPLHFKRFITRRRVIIVIIASWVLSILSGIFGLTSFTINEANECKDQYSYAHSQTIIAYYWFCIRLVIPCFTMLITQTLIARKLSKESRNFKGITNATNGKRVVTFHIVARRRVLQMMLMVIITYVICWTPSQIAYMGYLLGWVPVSFLNSDLHRVLVVLGFYNSCANPVIYTARYPEFRHALKDIFTCTSSKEDALFEKERISQNIPDTNIDPEI